jgi:predicted NBD/HSP70 family sugar kinase/DNA-binding transcriptional ArsR family regulator
VEHLGGSSKLLRAMNEAAALSHVLDRGRLTRAELRELTGLSKPTISDAFKRLTESGLVTVVGYESGRPGPNAEIYSVNPDAAFAVAVSVREVSNSHAPAATAAICDLAGAVRARIEAPVDFSTADAAATVVEIVDQVCAAAGIERSKVSRLQLAVAGSYDPQADVIHHVDVPGFARTGLVGDLRRLLDAPIGVDNDVNLAAVAERKRGVGRDVDGFAMVWIGESGLGLAIDLGGPLLRGARGGAGEIGYMPMVAPGGGPKVDFHDLVGPHAVRDLAAEYGIRAGSATAAVRAAVERADEAARSFIAALAGRLAIGLAAVVAVLDPPLVVLAGEIGQAGGTTLGDAVTAAMVEAAPLETTIAVTALNDDAPLLGAVDAALSAVRDEILTALRQPSLH